MNKILFLTAGHLFFGLGITGVLFPVLPTTPFLLLSAACFMKSSEKLYSRLMNHAVFGPHLQAYFTHKAISRKAKIISITALWAGISITVIFFINPTWLRMLLAGVASGVTVFLAKLKTLTEDMLI